MKKFLKKTVISVLLGGVLLFAMPAVPALAASGTWYTIDMNTAAARVMTAHGAANRTQSLAGMAQDNNAFAAINGTYFNAYGGTPFPDGTVMRDGKLLHIGGGAVMGITSDGRLLIDRLDITINCTVNDAQTFTLPARLSRFRPAVLPLCSMLTQNATSMWAIRLVTGQHSIPLTPARRIGRMCSRLWEPAPACSSTAT